MIDFNQFGLPELLLTALKKIHFKEPTPIQVQAIPVALKGGDVLATAQTGTGKTAAFGIPLLVYLMNAPKQTALVLTPTRELATQVIEFFHKLLGPNRSINTALLIGGDSIVRQFKQLKANPQLIVGTPGRINDHLNRGSLNLSKTHYLVLDETDRMLDMGFSVQLDEILKHLPAKRQTLMFSATLPQNIVKLSKKYLVDPERIEIGSTNTPIERIDQVIINTTDKEKFQHLIIELDARAGSIIIFAKTKRGVDRLVDRLVEEDHDAIAIHGDLPQRKRDRVMQDFRRQKYRILVATDIAARGLDIPHIAHVVNYDLPQSPEDYIHRVGRTARAGAEGAALCLITPADRGKWRQIQRLIDPEFKDDGPRDRDEEGSRPRRRSSGSRSGGPGRPRSGFGGGGAGRGRGPSRSGGERRSSDRAGDDRPARARPSGDDARPARRSSDDRPPRRFNDDHRPQRSRGGDDSRSPRRSNDDRPVRRYNDDRPAPARLGDDRPRRADGDRPAKKRPGGFGNRRPGGPPKKGPRS